MKFLLYHDVRAFSHDVMEALAQDEIQNNLLISNCLRGMEGMDASNWFMAVVKDGEGGLRLVALMTPPHNIVLYELNNVPHQEALELLLNELALLRVQVPGVLAEMSLAGRFAHGISSKFKMGSQMVKRMRIYRLDKVNDLFFSPGRMRPADEKDLYFLSYWDLAFDADCGLEGGDLLKSVERCKRLVADQALYIWEDGMPVSQAASGRKTLHGAVVNSVYTPPHYRGKGYASSCVASLSRLLLDKGYQFCSLFADLDNPTSNSIYMKIGYKPVCDFHEYKFQP